MKALKLLIAILLVLALFGTVYLMMTYETVLFVVCVVTWSICLIGLIYAMYGLVDLIMDIWLEK